MKTYGHLTQDQINFNLLSPFSIQKMFAGLIAPMDHIERKTKLVEQIISILSD